MWIKATQMYSNKFEAERKVRTRLHNQKIDLISFLKSKTEYPPMTENWTDEKVIKSKAQYELCREILERISE